MNDNFLFRADDAAFKKLVEAVSPYPKTCNLLRLAISLGAIVAGGAAISLFEGSHGGKYRTARDLDLWFPNQEILDAFLMSTKLIDDIRFKRSFGGHAFDIMTSEYGPELQVIAFRVGDPVEIISQFDFLNCAVAFDDKGFWYHKDVPELLSTKKLVLQNNNSAFFVSRVFKYLRKGFHTLDQTIQDRLYDELNKMADKVIQTAENFDSSLPRPLQEYDAEYKPMLQAIHNAESVLNRFISFSKYQRKTDGMTGSKMSIEVFRPEQKEQLSEKLNKISNLQKNVKTVRTKTYNLPYGYYNGASDSNEPTVDAFLNLV